MDPQQRAKLYRLINSHPDRGDATTRFRHGLHSRGYLPHLKKEGACYFVTFRLADSIPQSVLSQWLADKEEAIRRLGLDNPETRQATPGVLAINQTFQRKIETYLDRGTGCCHLRHPPIAGIVCDALNHFDRDRYVLDEWTVMPNHVHVIFLPLADRLVSDILKSWKGYTAWKANAHLGRTGQRFWQPESYDHFIRDDAELARLRRYVRFNPVHANLCKVPEEWRWGSAWSGE